MTNDSYDEDAPLDVGYLYEIEDRYAINIYSSDDNIAQFYEKFQISGPAFFIVISNQIGYKIERNGIPFKTNSTCLVLTSKGLGRVYLGSSDYNSWRFKKIDT